MAVSGRVADERQEAYLDYVSGTRVRRGRSGPDTYLIVKRGNGYRIHEDGSSMIPGTTGRAVVVGAMVRRFDPEAGAQEGQPATFKTPEQAAEYVRRWL